MASKRMISTGIWSDERFTELSAHAQLVFLRLVTGEETTTAGASEVRPKRLAVDTNLGRADVEGALVELVACDLVRRYDGWLWMPNWIRHQVQGPAFIRSARRATRGMPEAMRKAIGRAIDAHVGAGDAEEPKTPAAEEQTGSAATRTRKPATSRAKRDRPPSGPGTDPPPVQGPSGDPPEREVQDQDQDQDPALRAKGPSGTRKRRKSAAAELEPAAQPPGENGAGDLGRVDLDRVEAAMPESVRGAVKRGRRTARAGRGAR